MIRVCCSYYMRCVSTVFAVGQELPFLEVPAPNTRRGAAVQRDMVQLAIYRLFRQSHDVPPRLHIDDLRKYTLLPELTLRYEYTSIQVHTLMYTHTRRICLLLATRSHKLSENVHLNLQSTLTTVISRKVMFTLFRYCEYPLLEYTYSVYTRTVRLLYSCMWKHEQIELLEQEATQAVCGFQEVRHWA